MKSTPKYLYRIVQIAAVCVFLGRAWQHIFWDAPLRTVLWEEDWMKWIVENGLNMSWENYVSSPQVDLFIQQLVQGFGFFYLACAIVAGFINFQVFKKLRVLLILGSGSLILLAICYMKVAFFSLGQFFEYTLQFSAPLFLWYLSKEGSWTPRFIFWVKIAIALTFLCHGLYAYGYYPRPGNFVQMVITIFGVEENVAISFLNIAGILDFLIAGMVFIPKRWVWIVLAYASIWGFFTALARVWANFYPQFWAESLSVWVPETVYRMPHFLIPLALAYYLFNNELSTKSQ